MSLQKIKWMIAETPKSLSEITELLQKSPYDDDKKSGFLNLKFTGPNRITAMFSECKQTTAREMDPFGNMTKQQIISYSYINFSVDEVAKNILLISIFSTNTPTTTFCNRLGELLGKPITSNQFQIDLPVFLQIFKECCHITSVKIEKLKISDLMFNQNSRATIEMTSNRDAYEDIVCLTHNRHYQLDWVKAKAIYHNCPICFEIGKSARAQFDDQHTGLFISLIKEYCREVA